VIPKERKQGLGELLIIAAHVEAISRGRELSHLLVCDRNEAAVKLYKKLGFNADFVSNDKTHNLLMGTCLARPTMH
jgi:ribosomal protein S18 acetylase RimI-like enzyme